MNCLQEAPLSDAVGGEEGEGWVAERGWINVGRGNRGGTKG